MPSLEMRPSGRKQRLTNGYNIGALIVVVVAVVMDAAVVAVAEPLADGDVSVDEWIQVLLEEKEQTSVFLLIV